VIGAVDHGGCLIEEHDLVDILDLARVEHDLLAVDDLHAGLLQLEEHRGLGKIDADRQLFDTGFLEKRHDFGGVALHQADGGRHGAAHAEHAGTTIGRIEPVAIKAVVNRGRAEIPDYRLLAAGKKGEPTELIALPFADLCGGNVTDIVDIEEEQRAALGIFQRLSRPGQPIGP
jgi:hypothetical protein